MDRQTDGHFRDSIANIATMGSERSTGREHRCRVLLEVVSTRIGSPSLLENRLPHYGLRSPVSQPSIALAYAVMSPPSSQNCQAHELAMPAWRCDFSCDPKISMTYVTIQPKPQVQTLPIGSIRQPLGQTGLGSDESELEYSLSISRFAVNLAHIPRFQRAGFEAFERGTDDE